MSYAQDISSVTQVMPQGISSITEVISYGTSSLKVLPCESNKRKKNSKN